MKTVKVILKKRNEKNEFVPIWQTLIDPASRIVNPAMKPKEFESWDFMVNGPSQEKVDIVVLGDGYTQQQMDKFHRDVESMIGELFKVEPFKSRKQDFNVRAVETPSAVSYEIGEVKVEPWEANVTALPDPSDLKWQEMVESGTPIPSPWPKEEFDTFSYEIQKKRKELRSQKAPEEKLEALFNKQKKGETKMLENFEYSGKVGAYEGANYMQHGMYRSYPDCIMFTRNHNDFCPACQRAIGWVIDQYTE